MEKNKEKKTTKKYKYRVNHENIGIDNFFHIVSRNEGKQENRLNPMYSKEDEKKYIIDCDKIDYDKLFSDYLQGISEKQTDKKLFFVYGTPGSGKSTFAREIAEKNKAFIFDTDVFQKYFVKPSNIVMSIVRTIQHRENIKKEIFSYIERRTDDGLNILVDTPNQKSIEEIYNFCTKKEYKIEASIIFTDMYTCLKRVYNRGKYEGRAIPYDFYVSKMTNMFSNVVKFFFSKKDININLYNNDKKMEKIGNYTNGKLEITNLPLFLTSIKKMNTDYMNKDAKDIFDVFRVNGKYMYGEEAKITGFIEMLKICERIFYKDVKGQIYNFELSNNQKIMINGKEVEKEKFMNEIKEIEINEKVKEVKINNVELKFNKNSINKTKSKSSKIY